DGKSGQNVPNPHLSLAGDRCPDDENTGCRQQQSFVEQKAISPMGKDINKSPDEEYLKRNGLLEKPGDNIVALETMKVRIGDTAELAQQINVAPCRRVGLKHFVKSLQHRIRNRHRDAFDPRYLSKSVQGCTLEFIRTNLRKSSVK